MNAIRRFILSTFISVLLALTPGAQAQDTRSAFSEAEALSMAQDWAERVGNADVAGLEKLLSSNYLHIHSTALVESKAQFLDAFKSMARKYDPIHFEELTVRANGYTAVVTGRFKLKAFVRDKTHEGINRFSLVLLKTASGHEVFSYQATPIPQPK